MENKILNDDIKRMMDYVNVYGFYEFKTAQINPSDVKIILGGISDTVGMYGIDLILSTLKKFIDNYEDFKSINLHKRILDKFSRKHDFRYSSENNVDVPGVNGCNIQISIESHNDICDVRINVYTIIECMSISIKSRSDEKVISDEDVIKVSYEYLKCEFYNHLVDAARERYTLIM